MQNEEDENDGKSESKFLNEINCISHVEIKEEIIIPENTSDGETTLSDNEKNIEMKMQDCSICSKYRSMFIILQNHDCESGDTKCNFCAEINHWLNCFKNHRETHENDFNHSSDSTVSDPEEVDGKCKICQKYEFMINLLKTHICREIVDQKCRECSEVLQWSVCYKSHFISHKTNKVLLKVKDENFSDSTVSDNEEIERLLPAFGQYQCIKCQVCLKYQGMLIILEENHDCNMKKSNQNCDKCNEIIQWYICFEKHKKTHEVIGKYTGSKFPVSNSYHFGRKFDCGICLKLNSVVTQLVKNHKCMENRDCRVCHEVSYWLSCLKKHKQSEEITVLSECEKLEAVKNLGRHPNCNVCLKFRTAIINLSDHVCVGKKGKQKCETCIEVSFWYDNFKLHENHHGKQISPLKNFLSSSGYKKRMRNENALNAQNSFTSDNCDKKFVNILSLKRRKICKIYRRSPIRLQYNSKVCKKTISNSSDWINHKESHQMKLFKCKKN